MWNGRQKTFHQNQSAGLTGHWPAPRVVTYPSAGEFHAAWCRGRFQKCLSPLISCRLESCPHRKLAPTEFKSAVKLCVKLNRCKPMCGRVIVMYVQDGRETGMKASFLPPYFIFKQESILISPSGSAKQERGWQGWVSPEDDSSYPAGQVFVLLSTNLTGRAKSAARRELPQRSGRGRSPSTRAQAVGDPFYPAPVPACRRWGKSNRPWLNPDGLWPVARPSLGPSLQ